MGILNMNVDAVSLFALMNYVKSTLCTQFNGAIA